MISQLVKDYEKSMRELSKKYYGNEFNWYLVGSKYSFYQELNSGVWDLWFDLKEDLKDEIIDTLTDYYMDCENVTIYNIVDDFVYMVIDFETEKEIIDLLNKIDNNEIDLF